MCGVTGIVAKQDVNQAFQGWNAFSEKLIADADPTNDRTPEECRDMFIWNHALEGADDVAAKYGYSGPSHERT